MSENTFNHKKISIIEPYRIIGTEIANLEIGSINNPKFFKITAGQRQKNSLLYHCKIGQNYYVYKIETINRKTITLLRKRDLLTMTIQICLNSGF